MIDTQQLEQLISIAEQGTLSKAAERLHLSQPAISRSMQRLENDLGVTLFDRQKNKIALNSNGELAVQYAQKITTQIQDMVNGVRALDRNQRTIAVGSCAPAPLWNIVPMLNTIYPEMTISSEIKEPDKLMQGLLDGTFHIIVAPTLINEPNVYCTKYGEEQLFFSLPPGHALSGKKGLHLKDLDGETMLLHSKIGFWHHMHMEKMKATHFLLQDDYSVFREVVQASALPSFTSDVVMEREGKPSNRVIIPILDEEAHATYYCICLAANQKKLSSFFHRIENDNS